MYHQPNIQTFYCILPVKRSSRRVGEALLFLLFLVTSVTVKGTFLIRSINASPVERSVMGGIPLFSTVFLLFLADSFLVTFLLCQFFIAFSDDGGKGRITIYSGKYPILLGSEVLNFQLPFDNQSKGGCLYATDR